MKYKQRGEYNKYPKEIEEGNLWRINESPPQWLIDQGKIIKITESGEYVFDTSPDSNGGLIFKSQRGGALATLPKDGYLLYSKEKGIIGLTEKQLNLLYEEKK